MTIKGVKPKTVVEFPYGVHLLFKSESSAISSMVKSSLASIERACICDFLMVVNGNLGCNLHGFGAGELLSRKSPPV